MSGEAIRVGLYVVPTDDELRERIEQLEKKVAEEREAKAS